MRRSSPRRRCCSARRLHPPIALPRRWPGGLVGRVTTDQFFWVLARVAGLSSYAALAIALVTGIALRTAVFDWLGRNRLVPSPHEFTVGLWIPLPGPYILGLMLDTTARIGLLVGISPFPSSYRTQ